MKLTHSIEIDEPVSQVFEFLTSHERMPSWVGTLQSSVSTVPDPTIVGAKFKQQHLERGKPIDFEGEVLRHESPSQFAFRLSNKDAAVTLSYELLPSPKGTLLNQTTEVKFNNMMLRMMAGAFEKTARERMESDLVALRSHLQSPK